MSSHPVKRTPQEHTVHILPVGLYVKVWIALVILMAGTLGVSYLSWPTIAMNLIAMTIAVIKASLVVLFFMGVKYGTNLTKFWALVGFSWVTLMTFILVDYGTRKYDPAQSLSWGTDPGNAMQHHQNDPQSWQKLKNGNGINLRVR
jgi:cytochrome c oxidase subunit 4